MLTQENKDGYNLTAIRKKSAKIIALEKKQEEERKPLKKAGHRAPPLNQFNTGYIKPKKNDPL